MAVFEEEVTKILLKFLDRKAKEAEDEIMTKGTLSEDKAIPLILKVQFNHIAHLDKEITEIRKVMDERFEKIEGRIEKIEERIEKIEGKIEKMEGRIEKMEERFGKVEKIIVAWLGIGFSFLAILITVFGLLK